MVVVSRGPFPSQATADEHRVPVPHVPAPARLEHITLASGPSAHLRRDRQPQAAPLDEALQHLSPGCPEQVVMAPQPAGDRGTPYHLQHCTNGSGLVCKCNERLSSMLCILSPYPQWREEEGLWGERAGRGVSSGC